MKGDTFKCDSAWGSACKGEPFYKEYEGRHYCVLHYPGMDKGAAFKEAIKRKLDAKDFDFTGIWFSSSEFFLNYKFDDLAIFSEATFNAEAEFKGAEFSLALFNRASFKKEALFQDAKFGSESSFHRCEAIFCNAKFEDTAYFKGAKFYGIADFAKAHFDLGAMFYRADFKRKANFRGAIFRCKSSPYMHGTSFYSANFADVADFKNTNFYGAANFAEATFESEVLFSNARFSSLLNLEHVIFKGSAKFGYMWGDREDVYGGYNNDTGFDEKARLRMDGAIAEIPERILFHSLTLKPNWFVHVDVRKFDFVDVNWCSGIKDEMEATKGIEINHYDDMDEKFDNWHKGIRVETMTQTTIETRPRIMPALLSIVYRQLAINAEENHRYEEASRFRYWSMDVHRRKYCRGLAFWRLHWWYWLVSGYGERILRAFMVLLGIWVIFAFLYTQAGFIQPLSIEKNAATEEPVKFYELKVPHALAYSLGVMTLQKPEVLPATWQARMLVNLEAILGPLQGALLALAVRRRFMR